MKKLDPKTIYLIYSAASALFFAIIFTVNMVYQATVVGLNPLQLVLVGTVLEASIFICEIPTGVVADVYSRRLSIILGVVLIGFGFILEASFPLFATVLLAQVLWGVGYTFTSGATDAWIADEIGENRVGQVFLRGAQAGVAGSLVGAIISVALGSVRVTVPIFTGGALFLLLGLFLTLFMPEHGFTPKVRAISRAVTPTVSENWQSMLHTLGSGVRLVRGKRVLVNILWIGVFYGLYSEGVDRLWTPHLLRDITLPNLGALKPVVWFGLISVVAQLLNLITTEVARRFLDPDDERASLWALFANSALLVASLVVFAVSRSFALALGTYWIMTISRNLNGSYFTAWVNRHLTSEVRATVLSMSSQVDAFGQILGGPVLGFIGNLVSIPAALLGSAVLLSPVLLLFSRMVRIERIERPESKVERSE